MRILDMSTSNDPLPIEFGRFVCCFVHPHHTEPRCSWVWTIMAATYRHEQEMKKKCARAVHTAQDPLEKLRLKCLMRGASGIKGISRYDVS